MSFFCKQAEASRYGASWILNAASLVGVAFLGLCSNVAAQVTFREEVQEGNGSVGVYLRFADSPNEVLKPYGYFKANSRWPSEGNGKTIIFVCWENPSPAFAKDMALSREAVANTWQANSRIEFRGWEQCGAKNAGIRVSIQDVGPHAIGLGKEVDGKPRGVVLNFTFANWGQACQPAGSFRDNCIRMLAIHEFGHAIGFAHEQNRPDKPGECTDPVQGPNGTVLLTPYDPSSVMNYCNHSNFADGGRLSALDVKALQLIYGVPQ